MDGNSVRLAGKLWNQRRPLSSKMAFEISLLERIGWVDEHRSLGAAGDDNEWAHRALRAGVRIIYDPAVTVVHLPRHRPAGRPERR